MSVKVWMAVFLYMALGWTCDMFRVSTDTQIVTSGKRHQLSETQKVKAGKENGQYSAVAQVRTGLMTGGCGWLAHQYSIGFKKRGDKIILLGRSPVIW